MAEDTAAGGPHGWAAAMRSRWTLLSLGCLCYWIATQALRPMVALRLADLGSGDALIGVILGLFSLATFALALPGGRLMDNFGLRRALLAGSAGMVVTGLAFAFSTLVWQVAAVLIVAGITELAVWLSMQALASQAGAGEDLRRHLALFSFAWGAGAAVGPSLGSALYARGDFAAVALLYAAMAGVALICAAAVPSVTRSAHRDEPPVAMRSAVRSMWSSSAVRSVLLSSFVVLFVYGIRNSFYPLLLEREGVPVPQIGLLLSTIGVASLLVRLPLPVLVRRIGPRRALILSMWLPIAGMTVTPWVSSMWLLLPAAAVVGLGMGINAPVTVELMALATAPRERGLAMGMRVSANRLAQMVQPVLFGTVAATIGMPFAFAAGGAFMAMIAAAVRSRD